MPAKWLITSSLGQSILSSRSPGESRDSPLVELGVPPTSLGASQSGLELKTTAPWSEALQAEHLVPKSVLLSNPPSGATAVRNVYSLKPKQTWEGTVIDVLDNCFRATLVDLTNRQNPDEEALFSLEEISEDDLPLVNIGSSFYWTIGNERTPAGQQKNTSIVQFRRIPFWTAASLEEAKKRAEHFQDLFDQTP